ncbi:MAG TPA: hypothetical protein VFT61_04565 [Sphingomicrobium sp.]|jgi:hypothetical protein|nr:hypothetical protein [Sphingomicrobium sp.]
MLPDDLPSGIRAALDRFKADQGSNITDDQLIAAALQAFLTARGYLDAPQTKPHREEQADHRDDINPENYD